MMELYMAISTLLLPVDTIRAALRVLRALEHMPQHPLTADVKVEQGELCDVRHVAARQQFAGTLGGAQKCRATTRLATAAAQSVRAPSRITLRTSYGNKPKRGRLPSRLAKAPHQAAASALDQ